VLSWNLQKYFENTPEDEIPRRILDKKLQFNTLVSRMEACVESYLENTHDCIFLFPEEIERDIYRLYELNQENKWILPDEFTELICQDPNDPWIILDMFNYLVDKYNI